MIIPKKEGGTEEQVLKKGAMKERKDEGEGGQMVKRSEQNN